MKTKNNIQSQNDLMKSDEPNYIEDEMKTEKILGMFWHCHHDNLAEWCYDYQERVDYIKKAKLKNEIKTRLKLFKPVKGKLPEEFVEADKKCDEAWKKYIEAGKKYIEAWKKYIEARKKYGEAWKKYESQIENLHRKECGCKEWNGEEIVFK